MFTRKLSGKWLINWHRCIPDRPIITSTNNRIETLQTGKCSFANSLTSCTLMQWTYKRLFICCFIGWQKAAETRHMIHLMT